MPKLKTIAWIIGAAIVALLLFLVPIQTYSENVYYNGETITGCTARKYILRGVIATAPNGTQYKWSDSAGAWSIV